MFFLQYFEETYLFDKNNNKRPLFPPSFWSNYESVLKKIPRTTNILESWHCRWTNLVCNNHLGIIKLVEELRKEQKKNGE